MRLEFEQAAKELAVLYERSITLAESEVKTTWSFQDTVKGIKGNPMKRHGRTDEEIDSDVLAGKAAEIGVAKLLGVDTFDVEWDENDRSTYAKDVVYNDIRIEIKSTHHRTLFSVPPNSFKTLTTHADQGLIDVLLFAHVERNDFSLLRVTPTLIVDPYPEGYTFRGLFDMKNGDRGGISHVYPAFQAYKRDLCYPLVDL